MINWPGLLELLEEEGVGSVPTDGVRYWLARLGGDFQVRVVLLWFFYSRSLVVQQWPLAFPMHVLGAPAEPSSLARPAQARLAAAGILCAETSVHHIIARNSRGIDHP